LVIEICYSWIISKAMPSCQKLIQRNVKAKNKKNGIMRKYAGMQPGKEVAAAVFQYLQRMKY